MSTGTQPAPQYYWATEPDLRKFGNELKARRTLYESACQSTGHVSLWRRAAALFYGWDPDTWRTSSTTTLGGAQGERMNTRSNVFRALVQQQGVLVTGSRLAFQARPRAYDATTTEIVEVANAWCDQILDEHADDAMNAAVTNAQLYGEGWVAATWDPMLGEVIGFQDDGVSQKRKGEFRATVHRPDEIVRDPDVTDGNHTWVGILRQRNRWDLLAMLPQHRDAILASTEVRSTNIYRAGIGYVQTPQRAGTGYADTVIVMEVYHRKCPACPDGRVTWLIDDTVIMDGPSLYDEIPVYLMAIERPPTDAFGYGPSWDLMGPQQWRDSVFSQAMTTKENFGLRAVAVMPGSKFDAETYGPFRVIETTQPPVPIDLEGNAVESAQSALAMITADMQMITGLNDAALGNAGKSTSGAALAMQSQISQQFNGNLQRAYAVLFEKVMTGAIKCLRSFSTEEHVVHVVGSNRSGVARRFMASDLNAIEGISVEIGNPALRTFGMRVEVANSLLQAKMLPSQESYLEMMSTGRVEPAFEGPQRLEAQIERENDRIAHGIPTTAIVTDIHAEHIRRHAVVLDDPTVRDNPQVMAAAQAHLTQHDQMWLQASLTPSGLAILAATGQQPHPGAAMIQAQQQAMMMASQQASANPAATPSADSQPTPPPGPAANPGPQPQNPPVPTEAKAMPTPGGPEMPQMPENAPPMA